MSLEFLPNEILLDIFCYFNGIDLLRIFYGLNFRLNNLLHDQFQKCSFKFNAISKYDFDIICQEYLSTMSNYILNLHLFDHEETPTQIQLFIFYTPIFDRFTQLQIFSLSNLRSYKILMKILEQCHNLRNLTHLNLLNCFFQDDQINCQLIIDSIWNLPKLIHCTIGIGIKGQGLFCIPTKISSTLQYISIEKIQIELNQIERLFECTPNLNHLSISVRSFIDNHYIPSSLSTLTNLSISSLITCNASNIGTLLQNTPNLQCLNIDLSSELIDGNQWEELIRNHLPKLENLQLKMKITLTTTQNLQGRVDTLMNSFQTPFWIDEHQWFVHCLVHDRTIYLYTLSNHYEGELPVVFQSTSHEYDEQEFYNKITKITSPTFFDQSISSSIDTSKIKYLGINLPINARFWSTITNLNQLKSLTIHCHANAFQKPIQTLLDRAPHLYKLSINQSSSIPLQTSIFKYRNISIRELDLRNINHYFDEDDCITLSQSSLGIQCEVLSILVQDPQSIICLVENMYKLRALTVRCQNENYIDDMKDDFIQRLKKYLPSRCVVIRDHKLTCNILIWI